MLDLWAQFYLGAPSYVNFFLLWGTKKFQNHFTTFSGVQINSFSQSTPFLGLFACCFPNYSPLLAIKKEATIEIYHCFFSLLFLKFKVERVQIYLFELKSVYSFMLYMCLFFAYFHCYFCKKHTVFIDCTFF